MKSGYCPRATTFWRDAAIAEPSFIVVNPANGHAHYVYLLRGWVRVDGADAADHAAVRYLVAIERAYTKALRADAGYAGLVQHNPFHTRYETFSGRDEPYSLRELAAHVGLPALAPRRKTKIRTDGRNVETFDRLRFWAYATIGEYRCGPRETWDEVCRRPRSRGRRGGPRSPPGSIASVHGSRSPRDRQKRRRLGVVAVRCKSESSRKS